jgi:hypothetical protein
MATKDTLFRKSKSEIKAESTNQTAKGIIEAEKVERQEKTARLRAARAERDASEAAQKASMPPAKPKRKRSAN